MDVLTSLRKYIKETFLLQSDAADVGDDDPLLESGIVDSMGILQFVNFIEAEYGIDVDDDEIVPENFETMTEIAAFVKAKRASSAT